MPWISSRVKQQLRSGEFIIPGDQWPLLVYRDHVYDPENPWNGLFRSVILISVSSLTSHTLTESRFTDPDVQAYFHLTQLC
jgi:hypothetical protein